MRNASSHLILGMGLLLSPNTSHAQPQKPDPDAAKISDMQLDLMRKDIRDQKKQIIAANLPLNGDEAAKFWPLYTDYTKETMKVNDDRYALVKEYAANYSNLTDKVAASYIRRWMAVDAVAIKLRQDWTPKFEQVLGETKAAMFLQLDRRLTLIQELQIASQVPLIQP